MKYLPHLAAGFGAIFVAWWVTRDGYAPALGIPFAYGLYTAAVAYLSMSALQHLHDRDKRARMVAIANLAAALGKQTARADEWHSNYAKIAELWGDQVCLQGKVDPELLLIAVRKLVAETAVELPPCQYIQGARGRYLDARNVVAALREAGLPFKDPP